MRVGIAGWFGSDNLGDEILLHTLMMAVRAVDPEATFVVFSPTPDRVAELHGVDVAHMPTIRARGATERQSAAQRAIRACDILFLGPGTVFQERSPNLPWPGTIPLFARIIGMARLAGTPVAVAGAGVREGGTQFGRRALRVMGALCVDVGVRDQRSASYFGRSAQVIGDMAYALRYPEVDREKPDRRFAVSMRPLAPETETSLLAAISACADRLRDDGWSGVFLPMAFGRGANGEDDRDIYDREFSAELELAANPLDGRGRLADALDEWLGTLATYRLVLGTRLHAAIPALALGVPTVGIAYERKVNDVFVDLGLERFVVQPDVDGDQLHRTALRALAEPEEFTRAAARIARQGEVANGYVAKVLRGLR